MSLDSLTSSNLLALREPKYQETAAHDHFGRGPSHQGRTQVLFKAFARKGLRLEGFPDEMTHCLREWLDQCPQVTSKRTHIKCNYNLLFQTTRASASSTSKIFIITTTRPARLTANFTSSLRSFSRPCPDKPFCCSPLRRTSTVIASIAEDDNYSQW